MWEYPQIDPIALALGPIKIHWYAISYLVGIGLAWWLMRIRRTNLGLKWTDDHISDLVFYAVLGVVLGGRIGYVVFYGYEAWFEDPLLIFKIWQGGMSFHGGMLGVLAGVWFFAYKRKKTFFFVADFIAPCIPLALGSGRLGNFVNAELPGRVTEVPWGVIYPGDTLIRHPSSLYQAALEGPVLFALLWLYAKQPRPEMSVSGLFLLGYGSFRFVTEFFREPDAHLGFIAFDWMTQGQLLSLPMVVLGLAFLTYSYTANRKISHKA